MINAATARIQTRIPPGQLAALIILVALLGIAVAFFQPIVFLVVAAIAVLVATYFTEFLAVFLFWALPYMVVNLPTGAFTVKLPEVVAYLFATAVAVKSFLRREPLKLPPASAQVFLYLAALALSTAFSPPISMPLIGDVKSFDRNSPNLRSLSLIIWLALSWLVVVGLYNVVGRDPKLYVRCVRAHILSSGLASVISVALYIMTLSGLTFINISNTMAHDLVPLSGDVFRLAGVAYEPLFLAFYILTALPVTLMVLCCRPGWLPRPVLILTLILQSTAMFLTFSAGGFAALIIVLIVLTPLLFRRGISMRAAMGATVGVLLAAGVVLAACLLFPAVAHILAITFDKITEGGDATRKGEWAVGYALIDHYPILGVGPGLAHYHFPLYHPKMHSQLLHLFSEVNNLYLNVLAETGVVGFVAFAYCAMCGLAALVTTLRRYGPRNVPVFSGLCASLIGCAVQYTSVNSLFLVYFCGLVGLTVAGARAAETGVEQLVSPDRYFHTAGKPKAAKT